MDLGLAGKVAVVTGAGKGIGLATVEAFVAEGACVVAGSRSANADLARLAAAHDVLVHEVDLTTPDGPGELVARGLEAHGHVDVLVNNLGRGDPRTGFLAVTDADWEATFAVNFLATVRACRAVLPSMIERGSGQIVNVSSVNGFLPVPRLVDYSAAKAALKSLSKALSEEFGPAGIRVNTVSPGPTRTPLWLDPESGLAVRTAANQGTTPEAFLEEMSASLAVRRFSEAAEIAAAIVFVASGRAGTLTGADVVVDGGRSKTM